LERRTSFWYPERAKAALLPRTEGEGRGPSLLEYTSHSTGERVESGLDMLQLLEISTGETLGDWVWRKAKAFFVECQEFVVMAERAEHRRNNTKGRLSLDFWKMAR
jgi:hypothetical protein